MNFRRKKTYHPLSTEQFKNENKRVTFKHFYSSQTQSNFNLKKCVTPQNFNFNASSFTVKPMSALPDPKAKKEPENLRSSSTNMVRMNKSIKYNKYFVKNQNQLNENFNNTIDVVSSFNIMEDGTYKYNKPDLCNEINSCKNITTKLPEV